MDGKMYFSYYDFCNASVKADGTLNKANVHRVSTKSVQYANHDILLSIADDYRVGIITCDENGTGLADNGWQYGTYKIDKGTYYMMQIGLTAEVSGVTADIPKFVNAVSYNASIAQVIEKFILNN